MYNQKILRKLYPDHLVFEISAAKATHLGYHRISSMKIDENVEQDIAIQNAHGNPTIYNRESIFITSAFIRAARLISHQKYSRPFTTSDPRDQNYLKSVIEFGYLIS